MKFKFTKTIIIISLKEFCKFLILCQRKDAEKRPCSMTMTIYVPEMVLDSLSKQRNCTELNIY